jgi:hypothetical protein
VASALEGQSVCPGDGKAVSAASLVIFEVFAPFPLQPRVRTNERVETIYVRCPVLGCFGYFTCLYQLLRLCGWKEVWQVVNGNESGEP